MRLSLEPDHYTGLETRTNHLAVEYLKTTVLLRSYLEKEHWITTKISGFIKKFE